MPRRNAGRLFTRVMGGLLTPHEGILSNGEEASFDPRSQSGVCLTALPLSAYHEHNRIEGWYNKYPADPKKRPLSPQSNKTELKLLVRKNTYILSAALMAASIVWAAHATPPMGSGYHPSRSTARGNGRRPSRRCARPLAESPFLTHEPFQRDCLEGTGRERFKRRSHWRGAIQRGSPGY